MRKSITKIVSAMIIGSMLLSGCVSKDTVNNVTEQASNSDKKHDDTSKKIANAKLGGDFDVVTFAEIKQKFGVDTTEFDIQPLYNVDPEAKFTFHFNSKVDPFQAVTVHTDKSCNLNSMLWTMNKAYFNEGGGIDVIVDRYNTVTLNVPDRLDYNINDNTWGHASKYYLSINYDINSDTPKKLDNPIIIPFTIKNDVQTPTTSHNITQTGDFEVTWAPVDNTDGYRVYEVYKSTDNNEKRGEYLDREYGYLGIHPKLVAELDSNTTKYNIAADTSNLQNEFVSSQNIMTGSTYYVTAVKGNKESNFGIEVNSSKYLGQLPYKVKDDFINEVDKLPDVMTVIMKDGSEAELPVNYTLLEDLYKNVGKVTYKYEVVGTRLTGKIHLNLGENGEYSEIITSKVPMNYTIYDNLDINTIPDSSFPIINDGKETKSDLTVIKDYNPNSRVVYLEDALNKITDLHAARMVTNGEFTSDPREIEVVDYNDRQNNLEERKKQLEDIFALTDNSNNTEVEETTKAVEETTEEFKETTEEVKETLEEVKETLEEVKETPEDDDKITSDNVIEKQIQNSSDKNKEGNIAEVPVNSNYFIIADTPEEEYLALHLINQTEKIRLDIVPKFADYDYFVDVYQKVDAQNPYYLGIEDISMDYNEDNGELYFIPTYRYDAVEAHKMQEEIYKESQKIVSEIVADDMTDEDKIKAVWNYLENNSEYDYKALEYAKANNFTVGEGFSKEFYSAFNTYGILVDKVGVCQSYAYTMNILLNEVGVKCRTLNGFSSKTLPHAWNAVNLNDKWYWIDATNNYNACLIPYYVYLTNSEFALNNEYVLGDRYELDSNLSNVLLSDNSKDWYIVNDSTISNDEEFIRKVVDGFNSTDKLTYAFRNTSGYKADLESEKLLVKLLKEFINAGTPKESIQYLNIADLGTYTVVVKDVNKLPTE